MKHLFSLAATGGLLAAALSAQAQFTVDGKASAAEIGLGIGKYQLAGTYSGNHLDADRGLQALYVGYTATTLNLLVVGSAEAADATTSYGYRGLVLYLNTPARSGVPAGVQLAGGNDGQSPLKHRPILDMQTDYGFRVSVGSAAATASDVYFSAVSYVTGPGAPAAGTDPYIGQGNKAGAVVTAPATATVLPGTKLAYFNTPSLTANTASSGLEIEIPLAALGGTVTAGSRLDLLAAYTDADGGFFSEVIPQIAGRTTTLGIDPNFTTIAGTQAVAFVLGTGVLATRAEAATAFDFNVFPNPAPGAATIAYRVPAGLQPVSLAVYNALGQLVRSVAPEQQAGSRQVRLGPLAAGAYLVKLQIGDQTTSRKVLID